MTYGGGSIKRTGVYQQVKDALKGFELLEFGGIEPNPHYETCMKAIEVVKEEKIDFLLAVGGGSVVDATKFIAAGALYPGDDPWDFFAYRHEIEPDEALPLGVVLTLPATGSEMRRRWLLDRRRLCRSFPFWIRNACSPCPTAR